MRLTAKSTPRAALARTAYGKTPLIQRGQQTALFGEEIFNFAVWGLSSRRLTAGKSEGYSLAKEPVVKSGGLCQRSTYPSERPPPAPAGSNNPSVILRAGSGIGLPLRRRPPLTSPRSGLEANKALCSSRFFNLFKQKEACVVPERFYRCLRPPRVLGSAN